MSIFPASWTDLVTEYAAWFFGFSIVSLILTFLLLPVLITSIPTDYFSASHRPPVKFRHPFVRFLFITTKNLLGLVFVFAGLVMLLLPGQGVLMLIIGLMIMDYPGKFAIERWIVRRAHLLRPLNWLRVRYGKPPLESPESHPEDDT